MTSYIIYNTVYILYRQEYTVSNIDRYQKVFLSDEAATLHLGGIEFV